MNSRQLEYVVAVCDTMSFSEAAKKLYVSQPSLSQYIKKVEKEIGAEIFVRTTPLKLTYEGEIFVRFARTVLSEERFLELEMADINENRIGQINIGAGPLNSSIVLPHVLERFVKGNPNVEINIVETMESDLLAALDAGQVDMILTVMNQISSDAYVVEEVSREQYVLVIPKQLDPFSKDYEKRLDKGDIPEINISDCRDIPYIMQSQAMPAHEIFEGLCRSEGFSPRSNITCKNINTAIKLAYEGIAACFAPSSIIDVLPKYMHCYKVKGAGDNRIIKVIYRKSMRLSKLQEDFIKDIKAYYS